MKFKDRFSLKNIVFSYLILSSVRGAVFPEKIMHEIQLSPREIKIEETCKETNYSRIGELTYLVSSGGIVSEGYDEIKNIGERYFLARKGLDEIILNSCGEKI